VREIQHRELLQMLSSGAQIVDALPSHEYDAAHISGGADRGAIHIPVGRILRDAPKLLDRARPVVVYCRDSL
jgi:rhodanese-related sulfurtransferase